jgi:DNA-directed RNA polymerase I, II, and III subunit RPABC5
MLSYIKLRSTPLNSAPLRMIIPVKCFTCGKVLADKYRYYLAEVRKIKLSRDLDVDKVIYLTAEYIDKTPEGEVMDSLGLTKMCCRRHMLTHVDII